MATRQPRRIISGGQTGVDRAGLDVAIYLEVEHGGWCPAGRRAEDGVIPDVYQLRETTQRDYAVRTEKNVVDADGTLVLFEPPLSGGTALTVALSRKHRRPHLAINIHEQVPDAAAVATVHDWVRDHGIEVLNVAGPRESNCPGIGSRAERFLLAVFDAERFGDESNHG